MNVPVANSGDKRGPGRPRLFDPDEVLDRAVELFWSDGFEAVDVERIARASGASKPSIYKLFGDKSSLFLHALGRYGQTIGARPLAAFEAEVDIANAVRALLEASVIAATTKGRASGCLIACVAAAQAHRSEPIRDAIAQGLASLASVLERRFRAATKSGQLSAAHSPRSRSRLVTDLMQGLTLRARSGSSRAQLLRDARSYVPLITG